VEPRGIESLASASATAKEALSPSLARQEVHGKAPPRNIPSDIFEPVRRGPTYQAHAGAWMLALAAEGLLARRVVRPDLAKPVNPGPVLATSSVETLAEEPDDIGVSDVG